MSDAPAAAPPETHGTASRLRVLPLSFGLLNLAILCFALLAGLPKYWDSDPSYRAYALNEQLTLTKVVTIDADRLAAFNAQSAGPPLPEHGLLAKVTSRASRPAIRTLYTLLGLSLLINGVCWLASARRTPP